MVPSLAYINLEFSHLMKGMALKRAGEIMELELTFLVVKALIHQMAASLLGLVILLKITIGLSFFPLAVHARTTVK